MKNLEELNRRAEENLQQSEQQGEGFIDQMVDPYIKGAQSFNVGLAHMLGLPGMATSGLRSIMGYEEDSAFPTGRELQQGMADIGMTYNPGEEPNTLFARFMENLGASSLPVAGIIGKAGRTGAKVLPWVTSELTASAGGAGGGKALESTEWGQENPQLARAVGELGGGLGGASSQSIGRLGKFALSNLNPKTIATEGPPLLRMLKAPMSGDWAYKRAVKSMMEHAESPEEAQRILRQARENPEEFVLTAAEKTGDPGIMRLRNRIEGEIPEEAQYGAQQISEATEELKTTTIPSKEGAGDVQVYLDDTLQRRGEEARKALQKAKRADKPEIYNKQARQKIEQAFDEAREQESKLWQDLPPGGSVEPARLNQVYTEELQDITKGGEIGEIDKSLRRKLGQKFNEKGELVGGELISPTKKEATPKELHQLYSTLGRRVRKLSQEAGNSNKIRILNKTRRAILEDLDATDVGGEYRKAINFSRQLNNKFTSGGLGEVLGFQRGLATPEEETLSQLLRGGGGEAKRNVEQLLEASSVSQDDVKNFIRSRFMMETTHEGTKRISKESGQKFLKTHRRLLDAFPDLRKELSGAVSKQKRVDVLKGYDQIENISPISKQKAAASLFLNREDPNSAVRTIIWGEGREGMNKTRYLKELKQMVSKDPTGKAKKGLKNAVVSELLEKAKVTAEGATTDEALISGKTFLRRLNALEDSLKQSGVMSNKEISRLRRIGGAFKKIETQRMKQQTKSITTDVPGQGLEALGRVLGAHVSRLIPGSGGAGVGLQEAQIGSSFGKRLINSLTTDEARNLLIRATRDDELMNDLLKNANKMKAEKQTGLLKRIVNKAKETAGRAQLPAATVTPPMVSAGRYAEEEGIKQEAKRKLRQLNPGP